MGVSGGGRIFCNRRLVALGGRKAVAGAGVGCGGGVGLGDGSREGVPVSCWTTSRKSLLLMLYTCG